MMHELVGEASPENGEGVVGWTSRQMQNPHSLQYHSGPGITQAGQTHQLEFDMFIFLLITLLIFNN